MNEETILSKESFFSFEFPVMITKNKTFKNKAFKKRNEREKI